MLESPCAGGVVFTQSAYKEVRRTRWSPELIDARQRKMVLRLVERYGLEPQLNIAMRLVSANWRRGTKDDEHLHLLMAAVISPDSCCVDVGANRGEFIARMIELAPQGRHIAIEPLPELAAHIARTQPRATVHEVAASNTSGNATFYRAVGRDGYSSLNADPRAGGEWDELVVRTERIDVILADHPPPSLLKIDVEGAEFDVLQGSVKTMEAHHPVLWFEHGRSYGSGSTASGEIWDLLTGLGYRIFDADGRGPLQRRELIGTPGDPRMWNWLAR
jgi:FkbM family methyltransferase